MGLTQNDFEFQSGLHIFIYLINSVGSLANCILTLWGLQESPCCKSVNYPGVHCEFCSVSKIVYLFNNIL